MNNRNIGYNESRRFLPVAFAEAPMFRLAILQELGQVPLASPIRLPQAPASPRRGRRVAASRRRLETDAR